MVDITKWTLNQIFSYSHAQEAVGKQTDETSVYFSKPSKPTETYLLLGPKKPTSGFYYGIITCHDVESMEAIQCQIADSSSLSLRLLLAGCVSKKTRLLIDRPIILFVLLNTKTFIQRSIRVNMSWNRRMWSLACRAHMIAVTGVYYSVLGGAYCSLGKSNTKYAYKAGALAIEQIKLAKRLKDPILECKCWLYFAEDLIQLGNLDKAAKIIAHQKEFISSIGDFTLTSLLESVLGKLDTAWGKA